MSTERIQRRLAAILAADVVGYSRLMGRDEAGTLAALKARRADVLAPLVAQHQGRVFKETGDGLFVEFGSAVNAVECAAAFQRAMAASNADVAAEDGRIVLRVGVHMGDVMVEESDLYGDGVNVAARIEGLAEPGGVAISDTVHEHVRGRIGIDFIDRGYHEVKNIERPVHVWAWSPEMSASEALKVDGAAPAEPAKPSIAVLPFDNLSGDPEQGYFADGITEDIITDLSKVSGLFVIARNSSFAYKGKSPDVRKVSRDLGVRYVLEGSVRRAANRVRINAQMIEGATGGHLWADRYDRDLSDIFAVQDEVTRTIVGALKVKLTAEEEALREGRAKVDPQAYDLLVRARQTMMQLRPEAATAARKMLDHVLEIDANMAGAYSRLALITFAEYANRWNGATEDALPRALALAEKAIEIDPNEPHAYVALGIALSWTHRLDDAEKAAERAIELDPNFADGYTGLGNIRDFQGRHEEAVALYTRAYRLDPQFDMALHFMGRALLALGRLDEAETAFRKRLTFTPHSDMTRFYLASLCGRTGRHEEARRYFREVREVNPNFSVEHLKRALPYRDPSVFDRLTEGLREAGIEI